MSEELHALRRVLVVQATGGVDVVVAAPPPAGAGIDPPLHGVAER